MGVGLDFSYSASEASQLQQRLARFLIFFECHTDQQHNYVSVELFFSFLLIFSKNLFLLLQPDCTLRVSPRETSVRGLVHSTLVFLQRQLSLCGLAFRLHAKKTDS